MLTDAEILRWCGPQSDFSTVRAYIGCWKRALTVVFHWTTERQDEWIAEILERFAASPDLMLHELPSYYIAQEIVRHDTASTGKDRAEKRRLIERLLNQGVSIPEQFVGVRDLLVSVVSLKGMEMDGRSATN